MAGFCHIVKFFLRTLVEEKKNVERKRGKKGSIFYFYFYF